jgi:hypothetical protein
MHDVVGAAEFSRAPGMAIQAELAVPRRALVERLCGRFPRGTPVRSLYLGGVAVADKGTSTTNARTDDDVSTKRVWST